MGEQLAGYAPQLGVLGVSEDAALLGTGGVTVLPTDPTVRLAPPVLLAGLLLAAVGAALIRARVMQARAG